jgi:predicted SAM-dependent methyltransferase
MLQLRAILQRTGLLEVRRMLRRALLRLRRRGQIRRYLEAHSSRKLQLGAGPNILPGWLNTDLFPESREIVFVDAATPLPFDDCSFDRVFSEHLIEHLEYRQGALMLRECFRVLRPGGRIRIATPDLRFLIELYNPEKSELQVRYVSWAAREFAPDARAAQEVFVINNFFRAWGHQFIYDRQALQEAMRGAGFTGFGPCRVGESDDRNLRGLEAHGRQIPEEFNELETLVLEGVKPG